MSIQSSTNPQSAKSANSQTLWALEHKYFDLWHTAEAFISLTGLRKHDKKSWLFRRGFKSLISLLAPVHKSPLHKVVASCHAYAA